jgi:hypothetical protein
MHGTQNEPGLIILLPSPIIIGGTRRRSRKRKEKNESHILCPLQGQVGNLSYHKVAFLSCPARTRE